LLAGEFPIMNDDAASRLAEYLRVSAPAGVHAVYLFGSHAEGRAHRESDVDVGVLLDWRRYPSSRERFDVRVDLGSELIQALGNNQVDVVILNDAPPELGRAIVTRGVRVFCSDPEADHAYVRDVQLRAADLVPFLERMRRIKLEALRR
jgi:predicted nucleotidyltransferase